MLHKIDLTPPPGVHGLAFQFKAIEMGEVAWWTLLRTFSDD